MKYKKIHILKTKVVIDTKDDYLFPLSFNTVTNKGPDFKPLLNQKTTIEIFKTITDNYFQDKFIKIYQ